MNLHKKIRNQVTIFGIIIILVFSSTPISNIFSYKARNDIKEEVNTIRTSPGNTWTVDDDGPADFSTIQEAIDTVISGDIIIVKDGLYVENIDIGTDNLTIRSENNPLNTIIQPAITNNHVITISAIAIEINGFTVENSGMNYAGIYFYDKYPILSNLNLRNNYYGIRCYLKSSAIYGDLNIWNSTFTENFIGISSYSDFSNRYGQVILNYSNFLNNTYGVYSSDWCGVAAYYGDFSNNSYGMYGNYKLSIGGYYSTYYNNDFAIYGENTWSINTRNSNFSFNNNAINGYGMTDFISDDSIFQDNLYGVYLQDMYNDGDSKAVLIRNTKFINNERGIYIYNGGGVENEVFNCTFQNNYIVAIDLASIYFSSTQIYLNNFIDNNIDIDTHNHGPFIFHSPIQTYFHEGIQFDNYLGNYWKSYSGTDGNNDGIGDIPYIIDSYNQDLYPLIEPFENYFSTVVDTNVPTLTTPNDITYEENTTSHMIIWTAVDTNPDVYIVYKDGIAIETGPWLSEDEIRIVIDILSVGSYNYTIIVYDESGNSVQDTVFVTVQDTTNPILSGPTDITYEENTTSHMIIWTAADTNPDVYIVYKDGIAIETGPWFSGDEIRIVIDNLSVGSYNYTIIVYDESDNSVQDTVIATVEYSTTPNQHICFELSEGWQDKELFVPTIRRSSEDPNKLEIGIFNRRDMWYVVKIYKRYEGGPWVEFIPQEWLDKWLLFYIAPYSERIFEYTPQIGEEIKIEVKNDLNDNTLAALWILDFATRFLLGFSISLEVTDLEESFVKLMLFWDEFALLGGLIRIGKYKEALLQFAKMLVTSTRLRELFSSLLLLVAQKEITPLQILGFASRLAVPISIFVRWPLWMSLVDNTQKEPFLEDVTLTAYNLSSLSNPNLWITKSLNIIRSDLYYVGETLKANFTIENKGTNQIILKSLTIGGRGPNEEVRDFTVKTDIIIHPGESYNYQGDLKLLVSGNYHFFIAYETYDHEWITSVPTEYGFENTLDIFVNPIPDEWNGAKIDSPADIRVIDLQGRITGFLNGEIYTEIPHSFYFDNIVVIYTPTESNLYQLEGYEGGTYNLTIANATKNHILNFTAVNIPISSNSIHQFSVDWEILYQGEEGVAIDIDLDGDGEFDYYFYSDSELTHDEYLDAIRDEKGKPSIPGFSLFILIGAIFIIILIKKIDHF
ncbi:hypothetical protein LCGC14_1224600 [marine sediment metagenome]|uniref:Periplasmic copper-binding protein NosD beta helix domain-containing protein n=1 Tax=marine sediment metagenome TaxID=412755 RepID=A0A0F9LXH7_9ZZZZ